MATPAIMPHAYKPTTLTALISREKIETPTNETMSSAKKEMGLAGVIASPK
jgi:hypothetical protein